MLQQWIIWTNREGQNPSKCYHSLENFGLASASIRVVSTPSGVQRSWTHMAYSPWGDVCHMAKSQVATLCVTHARPQGMASRGSQHPLEQPGWICVCPSGYHSQSHSECTLFLAEWLWWSQVGQECLGSGTYWVYQSGLLWSFLFGTNCWNSHTTRVPQSPRLVAGVQEGQSSRFSTNVEERIRAPQRASSWAIYTSRCKQNKMDVKSSSVPQIADLLCYIFEQKQLKPATIAGYRTAIADHLGSCGSIVSQSRELNGLSKFS